MWSGLWAIICKYIIDPLWDFLYSRIVEKIISIIRNPRESKGDHVSAMLWRSTRWRRPRTKTLIKIFSWEDNNVIRLPILVESLKRQRNLEKLWKALDPLVADQRVSESIKLFHSPSLCHWIEAFCCFCTIFTSDKSFKKRSNSNVKGICSDSLFLLDSALPVFANIDHANQGRLCKKILETFTTALGGMSNSWPDLMQNHLQRMIERTPALLKNVQIDHELQTLISKFSEQIPPAFESALNSQLVQFDAILNSVCDDDEGTCDLLRIWNYLNQDQGCLFLCGIIEHTVGSPAYMNPTITNTHKAIRIASAINRILSQCSKTCVRNTTETCKGTARIFLRNWMYNYACKLRVANPKAHEELSKAIMRFEKNINPNRDFRIPNRPLINSNGDIISNINVLNGVVKHVSEDGALFVYDQETLDKKIHFAEMNDNKLAFTVGGKYISKPLKEISIYEPMKVSHSPQRTVQLFGVKFINKLSPMDFDLCKKHANGVLV